MDFLRPLRLPLSLLFSLLFLSACALPLPTAQEAATVRDFLSLARFSQRLTDALVQRDHVQLQSLMGPTFVLADWHAEGREVPAEVATVQLRNRYLSVGSGAVISTDVDWTTLLGGADPLTLWGAQVKAVKAMYVTGLGANQQDEAVLIVAQRPDGSPYWYSMLVAAGGFQAKSASITASNAAPTTRAAVTMATVPLETTNVAMSDEASAERDAPQHLVFDFTTSSTMVHGILQPRGAQQYLVRALAGQRLALELASPGGQATFTISGLTDGAPLAAAAQPLRAWVGVVPSTQDYLITVAAPSATAFQLTTLLDPRQAPATPESAPTRVVFAAGTETTTVAAQVAAPERRRYLVRAGAGQTLHIVLTSPDDAANFTVQGVTDGRPLKRLDDQERDWSSTLALTQDYLVTVVTAGAAVNYTVDLSLQ